MLFYDKDQHLSNDITNAFFSPFKMQILTTKLFIPQLRSNVLSRPRLLRQVTDEQMCRLTLISAPAGYGKTTLIADLIEKEGWPTAFISLDAGDNDLKQFCHYLRKALNNVGQVKDIERLQSLENIQAEPLPVFLTTLVNTLSRLDVSVFVVLDDYQVITAQEVHDAVLFLLETLPQNVKMIIATRTDPPLRLAQFRA